MYYLKDIDNDKVKFLNELKKDLEEWEKKVGIDKLDDWTKKQLIKIARKSEEILKDSD